MDAAKLKLYSASKWALSQRSRTQIKTWLLSRRKKWASLYLRLYGSYTAKDLVKEISGRLEDDFEILMVHSAYDGLLPMYSGKPHEIIHELKQFCGPNRTLVMPAFVLGGRDYNPLAYYRTRSFDVKRTPSEMGLLTEIFRRTPGVQRTLHPTHSLSALGPLAPHFSAQHHLASTPSGRGTPFETMATHRTVIIGLGVEYYRCLTQIHAVEHLLGEDFPVTFDQERSPVTLVNADGNEFVYDLTVFKSHNEMDATILRSLLPPADLQEWKYRGTPLFLTFADKVTNCLIEAAKRKITVYGHDKAH